MRFGRGTFPHGDRLCHSKTSGGDNLYYLHDRLGSVRCVINHSSQVKNSYVYSPYGEQIIADESVENNVYYAGYNYDAGLGQYYVWARMYSPYLARFNGYDPVLGSFKEPFTLHQYLYCLNDPMNRVDLSGEFSLANLNVSQGISAGMRAWGMWSTGKDMQGRISRVIQGASIMQELKGAAFTFAMDRVGGKVAGDVAGVAFKKFRKASKNIAAFINRHHDEAGDMLHGHHYLPQFLGGAEEGGLIFLSQKMHTGRGGKSYHGILRKKLQKKYGKSCSKWSKDRWKQYIIDNDLQGEINEVLLDSAKDFDNIWGGTTMYDGTLLEMFSQGWK